MRINKYIEDDEEEISVIAVCYQPEFNPVEWERLNFHDNYFYRHRRNAQIDFPALRINRRDQKELYNPVYLD